VKYKVYMVSGVFIILVIFGIYGTARFMQKTSTPEYCGSCHVMIPQYEDWFYTGRHTHITCVDCHLPHNNKLNYVLWKGLDGAKDVVLFYTRLYGEVIHSSPHARRTIQANCIRCHSEMVSRIDGGAMQCWDCHRYFYHNVIH